MADVEWNGEWHPYAARFPMGSEEQIRRLADSIREAGQVDPCVMDPDGLGLDGRRRVAACRIVEVKPRWIVYSGDPYDLVAARNLQDRELTTGQRAMGEAIRLFEQGKRVQDKNGNWRWQRGSVPEAPDIVNSNNIDTWRGAMNRAGAILDWRPDLADDVLSGSSLDGAYRQATEEKERKDGEAKAEQARRERIASLPDDLAALVDNDVRDLDDAESEATARATVARVDEIRNGDGDPPPSFAERVESGDLAWTEAATLAEQWEQERAESIERDRERISNVIKGGWSALRRVASKPDHPYSRELLDGVGNGTRELIENTIEEIKKEAPQW